MQLLLVRVKFTFHIVNWGGGGFPQNSVHGFSDWIGCLCALMLLEKYILDRVAFVAFLILSECELQPLGLGIKKSSLPVYSSIIWVLSYSNWIYFPKCSPNKKGWCEH